MPSTQETPNSVIVAENLSKCYVFHRQPQGLAGALLGLLHREMTTVRAVEHFNLTVHRGEIVGLLGPNGAGKTTTIKMMSGLLAPTTGNLTVCGYHPFDRSYAFLSQISVIFGQKAMLWWDVSTRESMRIHRRMYDISRTQFNSTVGTLGELLGIADILDTPVRNLSLGQRMRCELGLALIHQPKLLFADEPTIGLDVEAKLVVRDMFHEINQNLGTTIVLTSHDMDDVQALSKRVIIVTHGRKTFDGELSELRKRTGLPTEIILSYRGTPTPPAPNALLPLTVSSHEIRMPRGKEPIGALIQAASQWGDLIDIRVVEPELDQIMAAIFHETEDDS